jgi:hypothetical protein
MEVWVVFLILAAACLLIGLVVSANKKQAAGPQKPGVALQPYNPGALDMPSNMPSNISLPTQWDELAITRQLQQLRDQKPNLIPHYIDSVKERWIVRQDDRTAQIRLQFLKSQVEQLKLAKELQQTIDDLQMLGLEKAKRVKTLQLETEQIDHQRRTLTRKEELEALKEQKQTELDIEEIEQKIRTLKNQTKTERPMTAEEQRAKDRSACEAKIQGLKQEKQKALKIDDEDERLLRVNAVDAALEREYERWAKLL